MERERLKGFIDKFYNDEPALGTRSILLRFVTDLWAASYISNEDWKWCKDYIHEKYMEVLREIYPNP